MGCCKRSTERKVYSKNTYIIKLERSQINHLTVYFKKLGKQQQQIKPKVSRKKEIIKIIEEINKIKTIKTK